MRIDKISLQNFRRFENVSITFDPNFNILIGDNGSGKTSIIEALNYNMSEFFIGIFGQQGFWQGIAFDDVRRVFHYDRAELQTPVIIKTEGIINSDFFTTSKQKSDISPNSKSQNRGNLKSIAQNLARKVQLGDAVNLPIIVYYSNGRLNLERNKSKVQSTYSRLEGGYYNSNTRASNGQYFKEWYKGKQATILQTGKVSFELNLIKEAVKACIPDATNIYYNFETGIDDIELEKKNGEKMPFRMLSEGYRNMLGIIADIAFRCASLNPHLGSDALLETEGVVLIDELDLYLHPIWQKRVVDDLIRTFPKIQFITTTHSPLIISSAKEGQTIVLNSDTTGEFKAEDKSYQAWAYEYILNDLMDYHESDNSPLNQLMDKLDSAFDSNNKDNYQIILNELKEVLNPNDPILTVQKLRLARLNLK